MTISTPVREMIVSDLRQNRLHAVVARRNDVGLSDVQRIAEEEGFTVRRSVSRPDLTSNYKTEVPERLRPFVLQMKQITDSWEVNDELREAREKYDRGEVEICTGRVHGKQFDMLYLCVIPRKKVDKTRRGYFNQNYEG